MRRSPYVLAAGVALACAGCGEPASRTPESAAPPPAAAPARTESPPPPLLALDPEGVRVVDASSGSTRPVPFGTGRDSVLAVLEALRGPPGEQGTNPECGAGPLGFAGWSDGLTLWFSRGAFAGWAVDGRADGSDRNGTMAGIATGSSLSDLRGVVAPVRVERSSLGTEFDAGGLHGLLGGTDSTARVTHLWAGTICAFR
jgi:hypothetical protein